MGGEQVNWEDLAKQAGADTSSPPPMDWEGEAKKAGAVGSEPAESKSPSAWETVKAINPTIASAAEFAGDVGKKFLPSTIPSDYVMGPVGLVTHPLDSAEALGEIGKQAAVAQGREFQKSYAAAKRGFGSWFEPGTLKEKSEGFNAGITEAAGHGLAGITPLFGPAAASAGEDIGAGRFREGATTGLATLGQALVPEAMRQAAPALKPVTALVKNPTRLIPRRTPPPVVEPSVKLNTVIQPHADVHVGDTTQLAKDVHPILEEHGVRNGVAPPRTVQHVADLTQSALDEHNTAFHAQLDPHASQSAPMPKMEPGIKKAFVDYFKDSDSALAKRIQDGTTTLGDLDKVRLAGRGMTEQSYTSSKNYGDATVKAIKAATANTKDVLYSEIEKANNLKPGTLNDLKNNQGNLLEFNNLIQKAALKEAKLSAPVAAGKKVPTTGTRAGRSIGRWGGATIGGGVGAGVGSLAGPVGTGAGGAVGAGVGALTGQEIGGRIGSRFGKPVGPLPDMQTAVRQAFENPPATAPRALTPPPVPPALPAAAVPAALPPAAVNAPGGPQAMSMTPAPPTPPAPMVPPGTQIVPPTPMPMPKGTIAPTGRPVPAPLETPPQLSPTIAGARPAVPATMLEPDLTGGPQAESGRAPVSGATPMVPPEQIAPPTPPPSPTRGVVGAGREAPSSAPTVIPKLPPKMAVPPAVPAEMFNQKVAQPPPTIDQVIQLLKSTNPKGANLTQGEAARVLAAVKEATGGRLSAPEENAMAREIMARAGRIHQNVNPPPPPKVEAPQAGASQEQPRYIRDAQGRLHFATTETPTFTTTGGGGQNYNPADVEALKASLATRPGSAIGEKPQMVGEGYGSQNKIVTQQDYEAAKKSFSDKVTRSGAGLSFLDALPDATRIGAYHFEAGVRTFADWSKKMIEELGEQIKPHLRAIFNDISNRRAATEKGNIFLGTAADQLNKTRGMERVKREVVNPDTRAKAIADAYDNLRHDPKNPNIKKSYSALINDIKDQWNYATKTLGIKFQGTKVDPYNNSTEMMNDVRRNNHLSFFQGGDIPKDHPLAARDPDTGLTYNDMFRAVHDLFGHAMEGFEFGPRGEENAWNAHRQMFDPRALPALTTETRGQNSWVNFGSHLRDATGNIPAKGAEGYIAPPDRPFAEQKAALLPQEFWFRPDEDTLRAVHYSPVKDLDVIDPNKFGTNPAIEGEERNRQSVTGFIPRSYLGVEGHYNEPRITSQPFSYHVDLAASKYYDIAKDPDGIFKKAYDENLGDTQEKINAAENAIRDAGYAGYRARGAIASFDPIQIASKSRQADLPQAAEVSGKEPDFFDYIEANNLSNNGQRTVNMLRGTDATADFQTVARFLTPEDVTAVTKSMQNHIVKMIRTLGDPALIEEASKAGSVARGWYQRTGDMLRFIFKDDANRFTDFFAAMSPMKSVENNFTDAFKLYSDWVQSGKPLGVANKWKVMEVVNKQQDIGLAGSMIRGKIADNLLHDFTPTGPKISPFAKNLKGYMQYVTKDRWVAFLHGVTTKAIESPARRLAMDAVSRAVGRRLNLLPAEVQETGWAFLRTVINLAEGEGITPHEAAQRIKTSDIRSGASEFVNLIANDQKIRNSLEALADATGNEGFRVSNIERSPEFSSIREQQQRSRGVQGGLTRASRDVLGRVAERAQAARSKSLRQESGDVSFNPEELSPPPQ